MTEQTQNQNPEEILVENEEVLAAETAEEQTVSGADTLTKERDEWKDKAYRLAAEMENLKRRTEKEIADARKYAVSSFARELLEVQDNLERALGVITNSAAENEGLKPVLEGVDMVKNQLSKAFDRMSIARIECVGQKLNPDLHQAVMQVPSEEEAGTVVTEIQAGYTIADRLLRPAMVAVATK